MLTLFFHLFAFYFNKYANEKIIYFKFGSKQLVLNISNVFIEDFNKDLKNEEYSKI